MRYAVAIRRAVILATLSIMVGAVYAALDWNGNGDLREPLTLAPADLPKHFGIRLEAVRLSAAGHMLDLRYRVTDPDQAKEIAREKPFLVDERGRKLSTPSFAKVGSLRQSPEQLEKGRVYFALFANPGRSVSKGETVTIVLDQVRVEGVAVQ